MKKNLWRLFLILLAMTSCQEDELQSVAFGTEQISVGTGQQSFTVQIIANCPWVIQGNNERAYFNTTSGFGNAVVEIFVFRNSSYEAGQYVFTLSSEDGSSTSELVVVQQPRIKMEMTTDGDVPADGGYFNIYLKTNDKVQVSEIPEWVTNIQSRALDKYVYTLECMPNRSGKPRSGTVVFTGRSDEHSINIRQDSYTPDSLKLSVPDKLVNGLQNYKYSMDVFPVYADWTKLKPELVAEKGKNGKATIEKGYLHLDFPDYGNYTLSVWANGKMVYESKIQMCPVDAVLYAENEEKVCLGENRILTDENCDLRFSNRGMVVEQTDGSWRFVREGRLTVTATNRYSGKTKTITLDIKRIILTLKEARVNASGDKWKVTPLFSARCCDVTEYQFYMTDNVDPSTRINQVDGVADQVGLQEILYSGPTVLVPGTAQDPVQQMLNGYTLHFIGTVNEQKHHVYQNF